jgi:hypothetical protein
MDPVHSIRAFVDGAARIVPGSNPNDQLRRGPTLDANRYHFGKRCVLKGRHYPKPSWPTRDSDKPVDPGKRRLGMGSTLVGAIETGPSYGNPQYNRPVWRTAFMALVTSRVATRQACQPALILAQ